MADGSVGPQPGPASASADPLAAGLGARAARVATVSLAAAACGLVALLLPSGQVKLGLLVLFVLIGPGSAIVAQVRIGEAYLVAPLILVSGLALSALLPTVMLLVRWWHPTVEIAVLVSGCAVSGCIGLWRRRSR